MSESTWDDPRITAYVLGELPEHELADFESELESNSELAAAVEQARNVTGQLESLYASEATATLDDQRREAIVLPSLGSDGSLGSQGSEGSVSLSGQASGSWKAPLLVLAMAASLLLLIGVGPWLNQQGFTVSELSGDRSLEPAARPTELATDETEFDDLAADEQAAAEVVADRSETRQPKVAEATSRLSVGNEDKYAFRASDESVPAESTVQQHAASGKVADAPFAEVDSVLPDLPDLSLPGLPDVTLMPKERSLPPALPASRDVSGKNVADEDAAGVIGDVQVEIVPELGTIVLRGSKRDVERVERELKELADAETESRGKSLRSAETAPLAPAPAREMAQQQMKLAEIEEDFKKQSALAKSERGRADVEQKLNAPASNLDLLSAQPTPVSGPSPAGESRFATPFYTKGAVVAGGITREALNGRAVIREQLLRRQSGSQTPDYGLPIDEGRGPGIAGDRFEPITDNPFKRVSEHPLSTFSVDVDTASYSKTRDFLMRAGQLPRPDAVRIEELLNYFDYDYAPPSAEDKHPFAARATVTACPWNKEHRLARIALKGKTMSKGERPACNLVFLLDTSGSMNASNKLPLVLDGMQMLLKQLSEKDQVAITVYAGSAGLVLDSTSAKKRKKIRKALNQLSAGGSTNGGAGIALAYQTARDNFITDGVNRVILCTDGDFNVGTTGTDELVRMVEKEAKGGVFLSVLGFGMGNHNDAMLEKVSGRGNGNYAFIDTDKEARKVLVDQTNGTLVTIAKDVKLQIEFNPKHVSSYRLIGYENRVLAKEDFNDDQKDAGEIGAGHAVTALYEIVPAGVEAGASRPKVDDLKYQNELKPTEAADSDEMMTLKLRYKQPDGDTSTLVEFPVTDDGGKFKDAEDDVRFAAAVAGFGMQLRRSEYAGSWTLSDVLKVAQDAKGEDKYELRAEFVELVRKAKELMGQE